MSDKKRYIDQAGLKFFYTNLKKVFRTEVQVAAQINSAISDYRRDAVQIVASKESVDSPAEGVLYIVDTVTGEAPEQVHSYKSWVYEGGAWVECDSSAALSNAIDALTTRVGNIEGVFNVDSNTGAVTCDASVTEGSTKAVSGGAVKTYVDTAIADYVPLSQKGAANGVATLGADGKIPNGQLPDLSITSVTTLDTKALYDAYLINSDNFALYEDNNVTKTSKEGDVLVVTDYDGNGHSKTFIITGYQPAVAEDLQAVPPVEGVNATLITKEISTAGYVTSVAGKFGDVTLASSDLTDVAGLAAAADLTTDSTVADKIVTPKDVNTMLAAHGFANDIANLQTVVNVDPSTGAVSLDDALDGTSTKGVQNKVVKEALDTKVNIADSITEEEVDALFVGENEIWVDSDWDAMTVLTKTGETATSLTKNEYGYYAIDTTEVPSDADTFVLSDGSSNTTGVLAATKAAIVAYKGKIISVANGSTDVTVVA